MDSIYTVPYMHVNDTDRQYIHTFTYIYISLIGIHSLARSPSHAARHTATPPSSSPGTSAVLVAILPLPVVDVAVGPLQDACPRAAARLDFLSFFLITVCSLSVSSSPPPIRSKDTTRACHHIGILAECTRECDPYTEGLQSRIQPQDTCARGYSDILLHGNL